MPENVEIMCKFVSYNTFTEVSQSETTAFEAGRPRVGRERSAKAQWSFAASRFPGSGAISKSPVAFCSEQPEGTVGI